MQAHLGAALPIAPSPGLVSAAFATPPRPSSPSKCKLNLQHDPESSSADVCQQPTSAAAEFPPQPPVSQAPRCAAAVYGRAPEAFTGPCTALPSSSAKPHLLRWNSSLARSGVCPQGCSRTCPGPEHLSPLLLRCLQLLFLDQQLLQMYGIFDVTAMS